MRLVKSTETLEKNEKKLLYMCNARPVLKMRAYFLMQQRITEILRNVTRATA